MSDRITGLYAAMQAVDPSVRIVEVTHDEILIECTEESMEAMKAVLIASGIGRSEPVLVDAPTHPWKADAPTPTHPWKKEIT